MSLPVPRCARRSSCPDIGKCLGALYSTNISDVVQKSTSVSCFWSLLVPVKKNELESSIAQSANLASASQSDTGHQTCGLGSGTCVGVSSLLTSIDREGNRLSGGTMASSLLDAGLGHSIDCWGNVISALHDSQGRHT